jgi:Family of unknown function (DUF5681)
MKGSAIVSKNSNAKKKPTSGYAVGYAKPPISGQFVKNASGNSKGRPKGRPSLHEILLEEIARIVKVKVGDQVLSIDKERAMLRGLIDKSVMGNIEAARCVLALRARAQAEMEVAPLQEPPLTADELAVLKMMTKPES